MQTQQHFHIYMYISHTYQEQKVSPDMLFTDSAPVDVLVNKTERLRAWKCHSHKEYAMAFLLYACKTGVNPNRFIPVVLTVAEQDIRGGKCLKRPNNEW